jgi:hypothetical protein
LGLNPNTKFLKKKIMYRTIIQSRSMLIMLAFTGLLISCEKEEAIADTENFVLQSVYEIEQRSGVGMDGCYELVFPVTIHFADGTTQEVGDYDALRLAIREWFQAHQTNRPRPVHRPTLELPFEVINEDGAVITVETAEDVFALRRACIRGHFGPFRPGHHGPARHCFRPVFPLTLGFPDNTQVTVSTPQELHLAVRTWRMDNPGVPGRPELVFPLTVQLNDGSQVVVNNREELRALKATCRG